MNNYVLFSSNFNRIEKNLMLAKKAIKLLNYSIDLIEFKNYKYDDVKYLYNATDMLLLTSIIF